LRLLFSIRSTQNKDAEALHIKLDEIIRALDNAQTALRVEDSNEKEHDRIRGDYLKLAECARPEVRNDPLKEVQFNSCRCVSRIGLCNVSLSETTYQIGCK
jgi:low affinity Fe/Cu permease